eukprot:6482012-Amphidinium_carterae.4
MNVRDSELILEKKQLRMSIAEAARTFGAGAKSSPPTSFALLPAQSGESVILVARVQGSNQGDFRADGQTEFQTKSVHHFAELSFVVSSLLAGIATPAKRFLALARSAVVAAPALVVSPRLDKERTGKKDKHTSLHTMIPKQYMLH